MDTSCSSLSSCATTDLHFCMLFLGATQIRMHHSHHGPCSTICKLSLTAYITEIRSLLSCESLREIYDRVVLASVRGMDHKLNQCGSNIPERRVWPCWGLHRAHAVIRGGLCGGGNETMHYNEGGWLLDDDSYWALRQFFLCSPSEVKFEHLDLNNVHLPHTAAGHAHTLFISNSDQSKKFLLHGRDALESQIADQCNVFLISMTKLTMVMNGKVEHLSERSQEDEKLPLVSDDSCKRTSLLKLKELRRQEMLMHLHSTNEGVMWGTPEANPSDRLWCFNQVLSLLYDE